MIRSKQIRSSINYWLGIVGYDSHDRSTLMRVYLLYVAAFFSVWTLSVMFLISGLLADTLSPFLASQGIAFTEFAPAMGTLFLILWALFSIHKAAHRSPLVFSEEDAYLLCQTPADRRVITLAWFLGEWPRSVLPILAGAVTVGFALLELDIEGGLGSLSLRHLAIAALKPLSIIIPLHLSLVAAVWVVGVYRLQRGVERIKLMRFLRVLTLILAIALFVIVLGRILLPPSFAIFQPLLSFLTFPLDAAFHEGMWGLDLAVTIGLMTINVALLWHISEDLNLGRAAQETHHFQATRVAFRIGDFDRIAEIKDRERLGSMHVPSRLPTFPGAWMMTWKDIVQSLRTLTISRLWPWLVIFFLTISGAVVGVILKDSASLFVLMVYWTILVGQQTSARLMKDLGNWWLLHSLPLSAKRMILHDTARPVFGIVVITWIAMWACSLLGASISPIIVFAVPFAVFGITCSSVFDMLRRADVGLLLVGRSPAFGLIGLVLGMICITMPAAIYFLTESYSLSPMVSVPSVILIGVFLAISLLYLSEKEFRRVG